MTAELPSTEQIFTETSRLVPLVLRQDFLVCISYRMTIVSCN